MMTEEENGCPNDDLPADFPPITVEQLDALVNHYFDLREQKSKIEADALAKGSEVNKAGAQIVAALKQLSRENYKTASGQVSLKQTWSVKVPQSDQEKQAFFGWLRDGGIFDRYATVNSKSLQSLYSAEWEAAKKRGEGMEFSIPGILPPTPYDTIHPTKARKS